MLRKLLCLLGFHEWIVTHETVDTRKLGYPQIFWYKCKHCGAIKK